MLVIFHFIIHSVKIIRVYVHILPKPHINVLYFQNENEKGCVLYFEENEKAVVFDIISFDCNACTRCMNHIFVAINILNETKRGNAV